MNSEIFTTPIFGLFEIRRPRVVDCRGSFVNLYRGIDDHIFDDSEISFTVDQVNLSYNETKGTIRGLHYQENPNSEAKLIQCLRGSVWDVAVDMRPESASYCTWHAIKLLPDCANSFFIPKGCAHGFQTLENHTEILYLHSGHWCPSAEVGLRWDDPTLNIEWPMYPSVISDRDKNLPYLKS